MNAKLGNLDTLPVYPGTVREIFDHEKPYFCSQFYIFNA